MAQARPGCAIDAKLSLRFKSGNRIVISDIYPMCKKNTKLKILDNMYYYMYIKLYGIRIGRE